MLASTVTITIALIIRERVQDVFVSLFVTGRHSNEMDVGISFPGYCRGLGMIQEDARIQFGTLDLFGLWFLLVVDCC